MQLSADRRHFQLQQSSFYFTGCNCYYLMTRAAEPGLQHQVIEVLDGAVASGVTVVRTWAFNDGSEWNALQTAPGQCCPPSLRRSRPYSTMSTTNN